nr:immunoglobulin light chain junction region [Macaca mulatta]MOX07396.1 immunoglobulin light chain junction region [Macaca mulatta]MOX07534.1 immunoglobulin light chain junction region [Macaca mulatta]MOX07626.1 immunoglobulin light chain junction region [Macaca mulatta]MOX07685.1 immunoglobulin light chain junction region [Macaca mulatta]
CQQGHSDPPTF